MQVLKYKKKTRLEFAVTVAADAMKDVVVPVVVATATLFTASIIKNATTLHTPY